jgi:MinD superfamily P-loop ATPase
MALLGATGGVGTTTCAVALAGITERSFVLDLALANGDAADVAGVRISVPDALLRIACAPTATPAELAAGLAHGDACTVLAAPTLPEHADLIDERGVARVLDLAVASGLRAIVDCGARIGVETIPVLERATLLMIVAGADARGERGARRTSLLIARLGLGTRSSGIVATRCRNLRAARSLAAEAGLPLLAMVKSDGRVARARERGLPPPAAAFAALAEPARFAVS